MIELTTKCNNNTIFYLIENNDVNPGKHESDLLLNVSLIPENARSVGSPYNELHLRSNPLAAVTKVVRASHSRNLR